MVDVPGVALIALVADGPEGLVLHVLGETDDGVEGRLGLVAHMGEESGLGPVGGLGAVERIGKGVVLARHILDNLVEGLGQLAQLPVGPARWIFDLVRQAVASAAPATSTTAWIGLAK